MARNYSVATNSLNFRIKQLILLYTEQGATLLASQRGSRLRKETVTTQKGNDTRAHLPA